MFALDTNTLIYFFKGAGAVASRLASVAPRDVVLPAIVVYEIQVGIHRSRQPAKRRAQFDEFLSVVGVLPFDTEAARGSAEINAQLAARGASIGPADTLIAGIALAHRATLVTHNTAEFSRVRGLKLADWYTA